MTDLYMNDILDYEEIQNTFKSISEKTNKLLNLTAIAESIETYGLDESVMALINKDDQLSNELGFTKNDLNRSEEGLNDLFKDGIFKKIIDGIKWIIDKIIEAIKWVWSKLSEWATKNKISAAELQRAANNWDKLPDNAPLQPPDSNNPEQPWTNVPDFKICKERLTKCEQLCNEFFNSFLNPLSQIAAEYINTRTDTNPFVFYDVLRNNKFKDFINRLNIRAQCNGRGNILFPAMQMAYQEYIEDRNICEWADNSYPTIVEVRYKRDLGIKYKSEFNELGKTLTNIEHTLASHKQMFSTTEKTLKSLKDSYEKYSKDLLSHANAIEQTDPTLASDEKDKSRHYYDEAAQLTDFLKAFEFINVKLAQFVKIGMVNKLGIQKLIEDMKIMFK